MNTLLLALMLQSSQILPPRNAVENPAVVAQVPQKIRKDYDKLWTRFISAKEDGKLQKDLEKFVQKQKGFDPAIVIEGYLALYKGDSKFARDKFAQALTANPQNRIAIYYLAEIAYSNGDYARATTLYGQLQSVDSNHSDIETKRQKSFLLATDNLLRSAARSESENRLSEAEDAYRQALKLAPNEPALHMQFADLLLKENKKQEAEAENKVAENLSPYRSSQSHPVSQAKGEDLEDLGRWGSDIETFHQIRDSKAVTRAQFAMLLVRYFPQVTEFRQTPQIITDIKDSPARPEIQTVVDIGLIDAFPNHDFEPSIPISRGDLARAFARLSRLIRVSADQAKPVSAPDVAETNAMYPEVRLVLGYGVMSLEDSGSFNVSGDVTGGQAVQSAEQLLRIFQQVQR
jgi:tetratricopeptide (TPR) repeat protein